MDPILIPIVGMLIPIIIVPTAMGFKHARFLREVEHAERMRAMELGRTLAEDESWSPSSLAAMIGCVVPVAAMFLAWTAGKAAIDPGVLKAIWMTASLVGVSGVICGSILAAHHFAGAQRPATDLARAEKPEFDPDAYDVVGSRG